MIAQSPPADVPVPPPIVVLADPRTAATAVGCGLRAMHDRLPVGPPSVDRLVVCHGDACAPNTLPRDDGTWSGHVDLGALGVADRWADLAVATWSLDWNYGPGWQSVLLEAYGVEPDPLRIAYYRLL